MDKYIGKRLDGRYEIKELIGVGGMAYVYKAYDSIDDRVVAIKILRDEFMANEEFTRRFKNESKAIAILSHPNIVKVFDVSFGERLQYIVMEYIDGITLKEYIDQQKDIKWKEAVHFVVQILRALQHAHDKGIVHRDIKPQNIMLLPDGTIKVTDFGIARFSRSELHATGSTDKAIGSVHYISPEQARGEITDEKADIYSVGVMLYEMLTGRLPFEADNAVSVAIMQMQSEPKPPRSLNPEIPEGLEEITMKAMQKDPAKRYQSAAEMLYDIDEFKRNPSIHFEYKYFVDETPTRFVEAITRVKGEEPQTEPETEEEEPEEEERKGPPVLPILFAVAGAFVLAAIIFVMVLFFKGFGGDKGKENEVEVPNFVGMMYSDIANNSEYLGNFIFGDPITKNSDKPAGQVIEQSERPGSKMKIKQKEIILTVSNGPELVSIPQVRDNEHRDSMRSRLEAAGFTNIIETEINSDTVSKDFVVKTDPAYPNKVPKDTVITMYVSAGTEPLPEIEVPDVQSMGLSQADAITKLQEAGFIVNTSNITVKNSKKYDGKAGIVLEQSPAPGEKLTKGSEVRLTVSSGFQDVALTVKMPNIDTPMDIRVFINGKEKTELRESGIVPSLVPNGIWQATLTEQSASYSVVVYMAPSGSADSDFKPFAWYKVEKKSGKMVASLDRYEYPFGGYETDPSDDPNPPDSSDDSKPERPGN